MTYTVPHDSRDNKQRVDPINNHVHNKDINDLKKKVDEGNPIFVQSKSRIDESVMYYDDYVEITKLTEESPNLTISSAAGALEIITVGGIGYLHACDVGDGVITYSDGTEETIIVKKAQLDVFLILGQSNAMYRYSSDPSTASPVPPLGTAYYYGTPDDPVSNIFYDCSVNDYRMHSMTESTNVAHIGNIEAPFAATYNKRTGHKVLTINGAIGGAPISTYLSGGLSYDYAQTVFSDALLTIDTAHYDFTVRSYIWIQGESDSDTDVETYKRSFMEIHRSLLGIGDIKFSPHNFNYGFISKVRSAEGVNSSIAQVQLAKECKTIHLASTASDSFSIDDETMLNDNLHYSQKGDNVIGAELGEYIGKVYSKK